MIREEKNWLLHSIISKGLQKCGHAVDQRLDRNLGAPILAHGDDSGVLDHGILDADKVLVSHLVVSVGVPQHQVSPLVTVRGDLNRTVAVNEGDGASHAIVNAVDSLLDRDAFAGLDLFLSGDLVEVGQTLEIPPVTTHASKQAQQSEPGVQNCRCKTLSVANEKILLRRWRAAVGAMDASKSWGARPVRGQT